MLLARCRLLARDRWARPGRFKIVLRACLKTGVPPLATLESRAAPRAESDTHHRTAAVVHPEPILAMRPAADEAVGTIGGIGMIGAAQIQLSMHHLAADIWHQQTIPEP